MPAFTSIVVCITNNRSQYACQFKQYIYIYILCKEVSAKQAFGNVKDKAALNQHYNPKNDISNDPLPKSA